MRDFRRQQQDFTLANRNVYALAILNRLQQHIALELIEKLRSFVVVIVLARVRPADDHDDEVVLIEYLLVAHRWLQQVTMIVNPLPEIECCEGPHFLPQLLSLTAIHFNSIAIGVGSRLTSTVVRQGPSAEKYSA